MRIAHNMYTSKNGRIGAHQSRPFQTQHTNRLFFQKDVVLTNLISTEVNGKMEIPKERPHHFRTERKMEISGINN